MTRSLLSIEMPIIQAPMAGAQGSALAIAVCTPAAWAAPCAMLSVDAMRAELAVIRAATRKPFNVNFFCHTPPTPNRDRQAAWRAALAPYYKEYGIDPETARRPRARAVHGIGGSRARRFPARGRQFPIWPRRKAISSRWRRISARRFFPARPRLKRRAGLKRMESTPSLPKPRSRRTPRPSSVATWRASWVALVPQVVRAVKVPVIAAGGIADAKASPQRWRLAQPAQLGTAYLLCPSEHERGASRCSEKPGRVPYRRHQRFQRPACAAS